MPANTAVEAAEQLADYLTKNLSAVPDYLQQATLSAIRPLSPVDRLVTGMEILYALLNLPDTPARQEGLGVLRDACIQVAQGDFWGKTGRALEMVKYVRVELGEWPESLPEPETFPEVDGQFLPPPPTMPLPTPETPSE